MRHALGEGRHFLGIFSPSGRLDGVADLAASHFEEQTHLGCIALLMIAADQRGQGLGRNVVHYLEDEAAARGTTEMVVHVQVNNPGAGRFWQCQGYNVCGAPELQPDGTTTVEMRKVLTA